MEVECIAVAEAATDGGMSIEEEELESTVAEEEELVGFRKEGKQQETEDTNRLDVSTAEERIVVVVVIAGSTAVAVDTVLVPDLFSLVSPILLDPPRILFCSIERGKMKAEGAKDTGDLLLNFLPHSLLLHSHSQGKNAKIPK